MILNLKFRNLIFEFTYSFFAFTFAHKIALYMNKSKIIIILIAVCYLLVHVYKGYWKNPEQIIASDVIEYYSYVPATFIYNDLTLKIQGSRSGIFNEQGVGAEA
jgi:hypothetical protein